MNYKDHGYNGKLDKSLVRAEMRSWNSSQNSRAHYEIIVNREGVPTTKVVLFREILNTIGYLEDELNLGFGPTNLGQSVEITGPVEVLAK